MRNIVCVVCSALVALSCVSAASAQELEIDFFESAGPTGDPNGIIGDPINSFVGNVGEWLSTSARPASMVSMAVNSDPARRTQGTNSLAITMVGDGTGGSVTHYDFPALTALNNPAATGDPWIDFVRLRYANYQTVGANPTNYDVRFDVILDPTLIPPVQAGQTGNDFLQINVLSNSGGSYTVAFNAIILNNQAMTTLRASAVPLVYQASVPAGGIGGLKFDFPTPPTTHQLGIGLNGRWTVGAAATIFVDNLRFVPRNPISAADLNHDLVLDRLDWNLFIQNHFLAGSDTFEKGDLVDNGINDLADFIRFEEVWDANNTLPLKAYLAQVPEPASVTLLALCGAACVGFGRRVARRRRVQAVLAVACTVAAFGATQPVQAQLATYTLYSFEAGLAPPDDFALPGGAVAGSTIAASTIGATNGGTGSLALNTPIDGFNELATNDAFGADPAYVNMNAALNAGAQYFELRMDVTYRSPASIPAGGTFANIALQIQNINPAVRITGATYDFTTPEQTITFSSPLSAWNLPNQGGVAGFYRYDLAVNGNWGFSPGTIFVDNIRLVQTAPVPLLKLRVNRGTGAVTMVNESASPITFDYLEVTSSPPNADFNADNIVDGADFLAWQRNLGTAANATRAQGDSNGDGAVNAADLATFRAQYGTPGGGVGSLSVAGWSSLDDQNVDIFDGADPDSIPGSNSAEGWAEAGGSSSTRLVEAFLAGSTTMASAATPISLGNAFVAHAAENLTFRYREPDRKGFMRVGLIEYFGGPATPVPEPMTAMMCGVAVVALAIRQRRS